MSNPSIIGTPKVSDHIFFGLYGDPGIGKTPVVGGSPGKVLIIRAAQSHNESWAPEDKARARSGEIQEAVVTDYDDMLKLLEHLRSPDGAKWDWVWVEDIQNVYDAMLDDLWDTVLIEKPARARYGLDKSEYGIVMERLQRWIRHAVGPDQFNFGFTAHPEKLLSPDKDADGDPIEKLMPFIQGKGMATKICGYMNVVAYMERTKVAGRDELAPVLRTRSLPETPFYATDKFNAFKGRLLDPTMSKVEAAIKKSRGSAPASSTAKKTATSAGRRKVVTRRGR